MARRERPKTLLRAVHETLQSYGFGAICAVIVLFFLPWWLKWLFFYFGGIIFIASLVVPFVDEWMPRSRVQVQNKAIFITGCDSGFGHRLAQRLDGLGIQVFAGCLFPKGDGAGELRKSCSDRLHIVSLDVTSEDDIQNAVKYVTDNLNENKLWAVVNNAGLNDGAELFWTNMDNILKVIEVNTFGVVRVTKAFLPLLVKSKGRVVTVASAAGRYTYPGMVPYCMSKQATVSFCDGLRLEMYRFGVKVVTIEPWMYKTPITEEKSILAYLSKSWEQASEEVKEFFPERYFERYKRATVKFINYSISSKPEEVVDCLEEGVMAMNPKYSYMPGTLYSRLMFWVLRRLPKPVADLAIHDECATPIY